MRTCLQVTWVVVGLAIAVFTPCVASLCCCPVQVQLERLTASFQNVTEDMRQRFVVDGQTMLDESIIGTSPIGSFRSNSMRNGFRQTSIGPSGEAWLLFINLPMMQHHLMVQFLPLQRQL